MYNRYIPDADGAFRRMTVETGGDAPEAGRPVRQSRTEIQTCAPTEAKRTQPGLLERLLPAGLDAGDLLVLAVVLLLLIDGEEDDRTSILFLLAAFFLF